MRNVFKLINLFMLAILIITFSCSNDDDVAIVIINLEDLEVTIDENPTTGQVIGTIQSDSNSSLTYSITTQTPAGALSIDAGTGELTVVDDALFDYEINPVITATIAADEAANTATVTVNLNNLEVTVQDLTVIIDENPAIDDVVGTIQANGASSFSITAQSFIGALNIDATTGELTVADATLFDFETNPIITATITDSEATSTAMVTINLANVNEITVQDITIVIDENPTSGVGIGVIQTTGGTALNFNITSQTPAGSLSVDAASGDIIIADATLFDFETNPTITATVTADDAIAPATITVNLNNVNELSIQDFTTDIDENSINGTSLGTVQAAGDGTLSFSIVSQSPTGALSINASTGELTITDQTLFNFETNPTITASIMVDNSMGTETGTATINLNNINELGDVTHGGMIFWLDPADNSHGLVFAFDNQISNLQWGCYSTTTGATGTAIGTGETNTATIVSLGCGTGGAVDVVSSLNYNGYSDWFLPSVDEMNEIDTNYSSILWPAIQANGGSALSGSNWTSTEETSTYSYLYYLGSSIASSFPKNFNRNVLPVRSF